MINRNANARANSAIARLDGCADADAVIAIYVETVSADSFGSDDVASIALSHAIEDRAEDGSIFAEAFDRICEL